MLKTLFIVIIIFSDILLAQNFFPVKMGNRYQVKEYYSGYTHGSGDYWGYKFWKFFPVQDTLINGNQFFRFSYSQIEPGQPFNPLCLYQYDTLVNKYFIKMPDNDTIRVAVDFNVPKDSSFTSYITGVPQSFISYGKSTVLVMGDSVTCFGIGSINYHPSRKYYFASGKGLYSFYYSNGDMWSNFDSDCDIVSAVIDTFIFNPITLKITSLSPLINRPLNTFPFVMHVDYQTNLDLTDTFKLYYKYQRDSNVYSFKTILFNYPYNITIQLPSGALPGDILKVRAEIRDESIFNNIASYPDTGYASILILSPTDVNDGNISYSFQLEQNYPNPFNPSTIIRYQIPKSGFVNLTVYDILGKEVAVLINEIKIKGYYNLTFDASGLSAGVYIYRLKVNDYVSSKKMILLK